MQNLSGIRVRGFSISKPDAGFSKLLLHHIYRLWNVINSI